MGWWGRLLGTTSQNEPIETYRVTLGDGSEYIHPREYAIEISRDTSLPDLQSSRDDFLSLVCKQQAQTPGERLVVDAV